MTFLLLIVLVAACVPVHAQSLIWRNDWTVQAPPTFNSYFTYPYLDYQQQEPFVFSPDGEVLMRTPTLGGQDDQIVRFTASGAVRWRVNLGSLGSMQYSGYNAMVGYADGSAIVAAQAGANVVKVGADGSIQWASVQRVYALVPLATQAIAALGCNTLSALDAQSGQLLWKRTFPGTPSRCVANGVVSDSTGNSYATFSTYSDTGSVNGFQLLKFDPGGNVLWRQTSMATQVMIPFGVGSSRVYVTQQYASPANSLQAFSANDGLPAWNVSGIAPLYIAGAPAEPIVSSANGMERLAETDGQPRWSQPLTDIRFASASGNRIIAGTTAVDATSGAVLWTASLPSADQDGNAVEYVTSGVLSDGTVVFAGRTFYASQQPFLQRVDSASGQRLNAFTLSPVTQSFLATNTIADVQTIAAATTAPTTTGPEMHVRVLEADTGALRWEATEQFDISVGNPYWTGLTSAGSAIAVTVTEPNAVWVGAYDHVNGSKRWSTFLQNQMTGQWQTTAYDPIADTAGNVFVSYGALVACPPIYYQWTTCTQLSVVKLNATDGSIAWQRDDLFPGAGIQIFPETITVVGTDVVVASNFASPYATSSLLKLSGADGSVVWTSNIFYAPNYLGGSVGGIYPVGDGNIIVTGSGWAKLDINTGATIWSNPSDYTCTNICYNYASVTLPDGSLLFAGEDNRRTWISLAPAVAGAASINWHPDQNDTNITRSFASIANLDSTGAVWMRVGRHYGSAEIASLVKFDMATGTFASQQSLHVYSDDLLLPWVSALMLAAPENNRLPAVTYINNPPAPFVNGDALVDSTITADGNLSMQIATDHAYVREGDLVNFHLIATYSGDAPISGARLVADLPWPGFATAVSCATQSASNCQLDTRASSIVANFDIQPGGHIDISGSIAVTATSSVARLRALVAGPIGLNELNMGDNAAATIVDQSLFADGFE